MTNYSNPDKEWRARKKLGIKLTGELTAEEDKKVKVEYLKMEGVISLILSGIRLFCSSLMEMIILMSAKFC